MIPSARLFRETLLLCALFGCLCFPLIFSKQECNYSQDESSFHLPAIRQIAAHWPLLDIANDSLSATAPGYHYFLATVSKVTGQSVVALRLVNWFVSSLVLAVLFRHVRRQLSGLDAALVLLPLTCSNFFVKSASWVVTDNAALLLITLCVLSCLRKRTDARQGWNESLLISVSVFVRQMTVWLAALPVAAAITGPSEERQRRLFRSSLCSIPPLAVLVLLTYRWSGLVPPAWREAAVTLSTVGPIYLLSVFSLFSFFYLPWSTRSEWSTWAKRPLAVAALAGLVLSFIQPTMADHATGHWGGYLWNLSNYFPDLAGRNLLFAVLCPLGAIAVARIWQLLSTDGHHQTATVFIVGLTAWAATFMLNRQAFQRYFEPTILVFFISLVPVLVQKTSNLRRWRIGLALCSAAQLGMTLVTAHLAVMR
jgi:hypothetical protein